MLAIFLVFVALSLANAAPEGVYNENGYLVCPNDAVDYDLRTRKPHCTDREPLRIPVVTAPRSTSEDASRQRAAPGSAQDPIDTLFPYPSFTGIGWNTLQFIAPIGRADTGDAVPYVGQTFRSLQKQNLATATFIFQTVDNPPKHYEFFMSVYLWDNVTQSPVGNALWATNTTQTVLSRDTFVQYDYDVQASTNVSSPINAALEADTNYIVIFYAVNDALAGTGQIGARTSVNAYADGQFITNVEQTPTLPRANWTYSNPANDAAFRLTFTNIVDCVGSWVPNPFWAASGGNASNCLETTCSNFPSTPQPGFLDEVYQVTTVASLNGKACNASYGIYNLPLVNSLPVGGVYPYYRLFTPCTQTNPCVNCGPSSTSACARTSANTPTAGCTASSSVTWPNGGSTSNTAPAAYPPTSAQWRENQTPPVPVACPAASTVNCPCQDCVTQWLDVGSCLPGPCGTTVGSQSQTAAIVALPSQSSPNPPQLFRDCSIQDPPFPSTRVVACASPLVPCTTTSPPTTSTTTTTTSTTTQTTTPTTTTTQTSTAPPTTTAQPTTTQPTTTEPIMPTE